MLRRAVAASQRVETEQAEHGSDRLKYVLPRPAKLRIVSESDMKQTSQKRCIASDKTRPQFRCSAPSGHGPDGVYCYRCAAKNRRK